MLSEWSFLYPVFLCQRGGEELVLASRARGGDSTGVCVARHVFLVTDLMNEVLLC
jgi:hypothetical protein